MKKWLLWLENKWGGGAEEKKRTNTYRWFIVVGLSGVMIMILNSFLTSEPLDSWNGAGPPTSQDQPPAAMASNQAAPSLFEEIELQYESRLKEMLEKVVGVGRVDVMVNVDSTEELIVYRNVRESTEVTNEKDSGGATRHITSTTRDGEITLLEVSGEQQPITVKTLKPKIRGVVVVAIGAENAVVKKLIMDAVMRGLDVKSYQVAVVPHKQK